MYSSSLCARLCRFVVSSQVPQVLLHRAVHREPRSSLSYRIAAPQRSRRIHYCLANRHSPSRCCRHALNWCQSPRANRFLRQQRLATRARAPFPLRPTPLRSQRRWLCQSLTPPCRLPLSTSAHLTLVNRFHDAQRPPAHGKLHLISPPSRYTPAKLSTLPRRIRPLLNPNRTTPSQLPIAHERDCHRTHTSISGECLRPESINTTHSIQPQGATASTHLPLLFFLHSARVSP